MSAKGTERLEHLLQVRQTELRDLRTSLLASLLHERQQMYIMLSILTSQSNTHQDRANLGTIGETLQHVSDQVRSHHVRICDCEASEQALWKELQRARKR